MADDHVIRRKTTMKLVSQLTPDELLKYGKALAQTEDDMRAE